MTGHATWPAERFYWCVLDAPGWSRAGVLPAGVRQRLEDEMPAPIGSLHAVAAPLAGARLLVCAAPREELDGAEALSLTPQSVPDFGAGGDPSRLNLLVGEFEPARVRRTRLRSHALGAGAVLACGLVLSAGLLRRASAWSEATTQLEECAAALTPSAGLDALAGQVAEARNVAEGAASVITIDAARALADVLSGWPSASIKSAAHSIAVDRTGASISVTVDGDPEPFLAGLRPPAGWRLDEPRLVNAGSVNRVTLKLRPEGEGR